MSASRLLALLKIQPAEAGMAGLVALFFGLVELGRALGDSAADALFFRRFGVENLPYMYMALGIVTFGASLAYAACLGRFDKRRFFSALLLLMAAVLLVERAAITLDVRALYPVLWLSLNVIFSLLGTVVWTTAGEACETRQAKRLFPIFVSAGILGGLLGSLITGPIARTLGTENLIVLYVLLLAAGALLIRRVARRHFRVTDRPRAEASFLADIGTGFGYVKRAPLLQLVAVSAVLFSILYFSVSFPFGRAAAAAFANEADLAGFLGLFKGVSSTLMFGAALLIANRLYARIGIVNALLILPVTYLLGFLLFATSFSLASAVVVRLAQLVVMSGIGDGAYGAFFNVVPPERRGQVRAFDAGVPSQIGVILSGVLLILVGRVLSTSGIFMMGMLVALLCAYVVWRMRGAYADALVGLLRAGRVEAFTEGHGIFAGLANDSEAVRVLTAALSDAKPAGRQLAAEVLARIGARPAVPALVAGLNAGDAGERVVFIEALGRLRACEAARPVAERLGDASPEVRRAALKALPALCEQADAGTQHAIRALLADPELAVRTQAAISLALSGDRGGALSALLGSLAGAPDERARAGVLQALEPVLRSAPPLPPHAIGEAAAELVRHLQDESPAVRAAACRALAAVQTPASLTALAGCLRDPAAVVRAAAAGSLRSIGPAAAPLALAELPEAPDPEIVLDALPVGDPAIREPLREYAQGELARLRRWRTARRAVPGAGRATTFLAFMLDSRAVQAEQRLIKIIGIFGHQTVMQLVARTVQSADAEARAAALETLDTLGDKQLVRLILPLLEDTARDEKRAPDDTGQTQTVIRGLILAGDALLQAVAMRAAGELALVSLLQDVQPFADHPDALLSAAAREAVHELGGAVETLPTLSLVERTLMLKEVPLFSDLSPDDLVQIAQSAQECWFPDGVVLCREGEKGDELFIIAAGQVRVTKGPDGQEQLVGVRSAGDFVGEMAIIDSVPRWATMTALGDTRTLVISSEIFRALLRDRPEVALAVMRGLAHRLREQG